MTRQRLSIVLMLASINGFIGSPASAHNRRSESDIKDIEISLTQGKTFADVARYFDPTMTLYDLMPPTFAGLPDIKKHLVRLLAEIKYFKTDIISMSIEADGELGFANSTQHITMFGDKGKPTFSANLRVTDCYHEVDGRWLIVSQHDSFPVDLATGKAVFDSH